MANKRCAVIGAGLGGLAAAVSLAGSGWEVGLYEANSRTGGKAGSIEMNDYRFDSGPSLLTMPFVLETIFREAGHSLEEYLTLEPLEKHCRYFYEDGTALTAFADRGTFSGEIESRTGDRARQVDRYLKYCARIYDLTADLFLLNDFHEVSTFLNLKALNTLFRIWQIDSMRSVHRANASFFSDPKTVQLFDRYATYNGSNPYRAPATLNIIPHVEYNMGSYIVKEGIYRIAESLTELARSLGVTVHTGTRVEKIHTDRKRVTGITAAGNFLPCETVVSNADVYSTYHDLLRDASSPGAKKYGRLEPSSSALVFYWGVTGGADGFGIHNILFSGDYRKEFTELFEEKRCPDDPTVYVYISSKFNPADAPKGCGNWFVMINAPYESGQNWDRETELARERIIEKIQRLTGIDISSRITCESVLTPPVIEESTSSRLGSIYGISSNSRTAAFLRHRVRSRTYRGLYFCGGSAHPGGGIPLVLLSGTIAARLIERHER